MTRLPEARTLLLVTSLALAACGRSGAKPEPTAQPPSASAPSSPPYAIATQTEPCRSSSPCTVTFRVEPRDGFHVNDQYPYKLIVDETQGVTFLSTPEARTFSKASGDYTLESPRLARMVVRFQPSAAGKAHIQGTLKLSVCSDESCHIDAAPVSADVDVTP